MLDIPVSDSITMRPTWRRRQMRAYLPLLQLTHPTAREIQDAIRVLEDPDNERLAPALNLEAFRIFEEASR